MRLPKVSSTCCALRTTITLSWIFLRLWVQRSSWPSWSSGTTGPTRQFLWNSFLQWKLPSGEHPCWSSGVSDQWAANIPHRQIKGMRSVSVLEQHPRNLNVKWTFIFQATTFAAPSSDRQGLQDQGVRKESVESRVTSRATRRATATLRATLARARSAKTSTSAGSLRHWTTPTLHWESQTTSRVSPLQLPDRDFTVL